MKPKMAISIGHMMNGEVRHVTSHTITSLAGLARIMEREWTSGWGLDVRMSRETLHALGGASRQDQNYGMVNVPGIAYPVLITLMGECG